VYPPIDNVNCVDIKIVTTRPYNPINYQIRSASSKRKLNTKSIETFDERGFYEKISTTSYSNYFCISKIPFQLMFENNKKVHLMNQNSRRGL